MPCDFKAVMEYMKRGDSLVEEFITAVYPPEKVQEALDKWSDDPGKVFRILIHF